MDSIGIDFVYIPEFQKRLDTNGGATAVFTDIELQQNPRLESLAGIFAAKEACMKAHGKKIDWRDVWVEKELSGKPLLFSSTLDKNTKANVSISHAGEYATAIVVINKD